MSVDQPSREYMLMQSRWRQMRDCVSGSEAIHGAGTRYLPALEGHNASARDDPYWSYNKRALYYNATARTIDGLTGMVFRRPPIVDLPDAAEELSKDVDGLGRTVEDFADAVTSELLTTGRVGILVDHTRANEPDFTAGEIGQARPPEERRPYLVMYQTEDILDVVYETAGGLRRIVQVRLHETQEVPSEGQEFDKKLVEIVRVLELVEGVYRQRVFVKQEGAVRSPNAPQHPTTFIEDEELEVIPTTPDGGTIDFVPFWIIGAGREPGKIVPPPLLDLSDVNLAHYRQDADYRNALHMAGVPTPVVSGQGDGSGITMRLGTAEGIFLANESAKAYFLSYGGEGVEPIRQALTDLEQQMAFLGARMLQPDKRGVEAAETARIHRMGEISILARLANTISNIYTAALKFMLEWAAIPTTDEQGCRLNDDFLPTQAPAQLLAEIVKTWQAGGVSHDSLWRFMQEGELVDPRRTIEEEQALIEQEQSEIDAEQQELEVESKRIGVEQQRVALEQQAGEKPAPPQRRQVA